MKSLSAILTFVLLSALVAPALLAQRRNPRANEYGVTLTFAIYGYDESKSQKFEDQIHLSTTFDTPDREIAFIRDRYGAEEMNLRRFKSVGLGDGEFYTDTNRLGPDFLSVTLIARDVSKTAAIFDINATYGKQTVMDYKHVKIERFETLLLKGKAGMFGIRTFVGPGGVNESTVAMQTLLVTITSDIVQIDRVQNRPRDLTHPTEENGAPIRMAENDKFSPPVIANRIDPTLPLRRPILNTVLLEGVITPDGKVTNIKVIRGVEPELDKIAIDAFRRFQFQGATLNDKPAYASWREEIAFKIPGQ